MIRIRHKVTGVVARVPEGKARRLGDQWEPADKPRRVRRKPDGWGVKPDGSGNDDHTR